MARDVTAQSEISQVESGLAKERARRRLLDTLMVRMSPAPALRSREAADALLPGVLAALDSFCERPRSIDEQLDVLLIGEPR